MMNIRLVKREEIEDKVWNGCVHFALNARPYGYTWYLDNVAEEWEGLVLNNYEAVFPLVHRKKWGVEYLYQPFFTQQLGLFSRFPITQALFTAFVEKIPQTYKYIDIYINEMNNYRPEGFTIEKRANYLLDLKRSYETIEKNYSSNLKRNLKKAAQHDLHITAGISPERMVKLFQENVGKHLPEITDQQYHTLHRLIYHSAHYGVGQVTGVLNKSRELISGSFFMFDRHRIYNLIPASNPEGKEKFAMPHLINYMILTNAGSQKMLDFEGSMIPSVARFFKSFGAEEVNYWHLKRNMLPWYLKLFKK